MTQTHDQSPDRDEADMDRAAALFHEIFAGLPRQGPGSAASTRRALDLVPGVGARSRLLDVGCGTGAQTLVLADSTRAPIVAVDRHLPFVETLNRKVQALGMADRVQAHVADMRRLGFADGSFDLIWCEGAIYNMGVEAALGDWRRLLRRDGHVAFTEVCWRRPEAPAECAAFWHREYPAIRDTPALLEAIESCGYETVGHFPLPASAWWDDYYRPLQQRVTALGERQRDAAAARELAHELQTEIDIWHAYSAFYGYEFFVLRAG